MRHVVLPPAWRLAVDLIDLLRGCLVPPGRRRTALSAFGSTRTVAFTDAMSQQMAQRDQSLCPALASISSVSNYRPKAIVHTIATSDPTSSTSPTTVARTMRRRLTLFGRRESRLKRSRFGAIAWYGGSGLSPGGLVSGSSDICRWYLRPVRRRGRRSKPAIVGHDARKRPRSHPTLR